MISRRQIRMVDASAPGLLKYGLHRNLSSDTDDSDYEPGIVKQTTLQKKKRKRVSSSSLQSSSSESTAESSASNDDDDEEVDNVDVKKKPKSKVRKKLETKRKQTKLKTTNKRPGRTTSKPRRFGEVRQSDDSDSDYLPNDAVEKLNAKREKRIKTVAKNSQQDVGPVIIKHPSAATNDTWSVLPTEILSKILFYVTGSDCKGVRYLCHCARVCRHWNFVISQPIVWKYVDLAFLGGAVVAKDKLLKQLAAERFQETKELNLSGWGSLTDTSLDYVIQGSPRLESLNLSNCQKKCLSKITGASLVAFAEKCPLRKITFSNLRIGSGFSKGIVTFLELRGSELTHINLSGNIALGSHVITVISSHCTQLISLDVSNTSIRKICFDKLQSTCTKLQELFLTNLSLEPKHATEYLGFPHLQICSVANGSHWITDDVMQDLLSCSTELTVLDTRGNTNISHEGLNLPCQRIERLFISHSRICLEMARMICEKWSKTLWDLDLSRAEPYGTNFDMIIDTLFNGPDMCEEVTRLNLSGTSVSNSSVKLILLTCGNLNSIDLTSARGVSRGIKRLHEGKEQIEDLREFYTV